MGEFLDKQGVTRFKEKLLTEVDKRIASGGGSSSSGDVPTKEEILEGATRVTDVEVDASVATHEALQTAVARMESNVDSKLPNTTTHIVETWSNGANWYRKYSDGWIEQGGKIGGATATETVTYPIAFKDTNYTLTGGFLTDSSNGSFYARAIAIARTYSTTGFTTNEVGDGNVREEVWWYACGY